MKLQETNITAPKPFQFTLDECVICTTPREEIISLLPCGHAKTCEVCSLKLIALSGTNSMCPICRSIITDYKKIYVWINDTLHTIYVYWDMYFIWNG